MDIIEGFSQAYLNTADHCRQVGSQPLRLYARLPLLQHLKLLTMLDNYAEDLGRWRELPQDFSSVAAVLRWVVRALPPLLTPPVPSFAQQLWANLMPHCLAHPLWPLLLLW